MGNNPALAALNGALDHRDEFIRSRAQTAMKTISKK
jgi:hypothetical protein